MTAIGDSIISYLRGALRRDKATVLSVFRAYTPGNPRIPGSVTQSQPRHPIGPDVQEHQHPINPARANFRDSFVSGGKEHPKLYEGWEFIESPGGLATVSGVTNTSAYVEYVEYGWVSKAGFWIPGHFMASSAMADPILTELYFSRAQQALVVGLREGFFKSPQSKAAASRGRSALIRGPAKAGASVYFRAGRIRVSGRSGRGVDPKALQRLMESYTNYLVGTFNRVRG